MYTYAMLVVDGIILFLDYFLASDPKKYLILVFVFFVINMVFFDFCKRKVPYEKKGIFYIWQFDDFKYCLIKEIIWIVLSFVYLIVWKG